MRRRTDKISGGFFYLPILIPLLILVQIQTAISRSSAPAEQAFEPAQLKGVIIDERGGAIPGAKVVLLDAQRLQVDLATTDDEGRFTFVNLKPGNYEIELSARGFASKRLTVDLSRGQVKHIEVSLPVASIIQTVEVIGTDPSSLEHIPGSGDIIDRETILRRHPFTVHEALRLVPGIHVRDEEGIGLRPNIGIRGLFPTRSSKVLLLEDGVPFTLAPYGDTASYYHPPVDRFERIEVLKGSGQILHGPQTIGGVINYITRQIPIKPSGSLIFLGGSRDSLKGHANFGRTWDKTGFLVDYTHKQSDGERDNTHANIDDVTAKFRVGLGMRQFLNFKFNVYEEGSQVTYAGLTEAEFRENPRQNPFKDDRMDFHRIGVHITHQFSFTENTLLATNFYGHFIERNWWRQNHNGVNNNVIPATAERTIPNDANTGRLREYWVWGVEPRLSLNGEMLGVRNRMDMGFRAHYETQNRLQINGASATARTGTTVEDNQRKTDAYALFIQNRFLLTDQITLTPGVRLEHVRHKRTNLLAAGGQGASGKMDLTEVIPGIGITYHPLSKITLFAGVHHGFAPPRTEDAIDNNGNPVELDAEKSWNYEVGIRSRPKSWINLESTLFRIDFENQIIPASIAGGTGAIFTNAGETLHQGLELKSLVDFGSLLNTPHQVGVDVSYTYLPIARFQGTRFSSVSGNQLLADEPQIVSITGNRLTYAPEHLLTAGLGYIHRTGIDVRLEAIYVGRQFSDDRNTIIATPNGRRGLIPPHAVWNLSANYKFKPYLTFFVTTKNLFDRLYIVDRSRGVRPGMPRLIQTGIYWTF